MDGRFLRPSMLLLCLRLFGRCILLGDVGRFFRGVVDVGSFAR